MGEITSVTGEVNTVMTGVVRYHPSGRGIGPSPSPRAIPHPTHKANPYPTLPFFTRTKGPTQIVGPFSKDCKTTAIKHTSK